uniref:MORN repeat-containing protein n=1 Tax=Curvibacter symbiont subsp. Hydra magnipapillata TaxID=667019 RepID=C9Y7W8_CURXX|nr:hypothetical protein Csp_A02190 [Curvibacter putative symbiont of Hydra magnipapillata]
MARTLIEVEHVAKGGCRIVLFEDALARDSEKDSALLSWSGKCKDGYADGLGTFVSKQKGIEITVTATLIRGRLEGEGTYEASKANGDREFFKGIFANGLRNGDGHQFTTKKGQTSATYTGNFAAGLPHGNGKLEYDGTIYTGDFIEGRATGIGTITSPSRVVYFGEVRDGKPSGNGKLTFTDGTTIAGTFSSNKPLTIGTIDSPKGYRYEGELDNYKPSGRGKLFNPMGSTFIGDFKNGRPIGMGVVETKAGERIEVTAINEKIIPRDPSVAKAQPAPVDEEEKTSWLQDLGAIAARINAAQNRPTPQGSIKSDRTSGFLKSERTSGFNKICIYDTIRGEVAIDRSATDICPLSPD